jgi:DNA-binding NarL/FixJ family response regulator
VVRAEGGAVDPCRRQVVVIDPSRAWAEALAKLASTALEVEARWSAPSDGVISELVEGANVVVLGDGDGTEALRDRVACIRALDRPTRVVVLTTGEAPRSGPLAPDAVVSREATADSFVQVVRSLLDGTRVAAIRADRPKVVHGRSGPRLTRAEARVLRQVAAGYSNDEIAGLLGISTNTVRTHVQRVTGKLGADSRLRAVALARESGVLDLPPISAAGR